MSGVNASHPSASDTSKICAPSSHVRYGLKPGDVLTSMNVREFDQLSTAQVAATRQARTSPAEVFELSHGDGGGVDVREEEVLGRAEGERLDDADGQEAVGHRTQRIRQRVLKLAVAGAVRSICCRAVQVTHRHVWCRGVGGARSEPINSSRLLCSRTFPLDFPQAFGRLTKS